ncbi:MAG: hypothetical protein WA803_21185 [Steroidobacteraceae bacterium]
MEAWTLQHLLVPTTRTRIAQLISEDLAYLLHPRNSGNKNKWKRDVGGHSMESRRKVGKLDDLGKCVLEKLKAAKS